MKLISLDVRVDGEGRRFVKFHDGLNLVTNRRGVGRSGNSVGKTTLSRVFDFLMLGSLDPVYIDEEFKRPNQEVESLFLTHDVTAELVFVGVDGQSHKLKRNFAVDGKVAIFVFDGVDVDIKGYEFFIQKYCFDVHTRRPTVRSVAAKFVRNDTHRMLNTTHFLDVRAANKEYSELYLYLFGFKNTELLTSKRDATNKLGKRKRHSQALNALVSEQKPSAEINRISKLAVKLEGDLLKFQYSPEFPDPVGVLQSIQSEEDRVLDSLLSVDRKIANIDKTVRILNDGSHLYLSDELRAIYEYAGVSIESVLKDLDSVFGFHENLVGRKKQYLESNFSSLVNEKEIFREKLDVLLGQKQKVFADIRSTESVLSITEKIRELGRVKVELGKLEGLVAQQSKAKDELALAEEFLGSVLAEIVEELNSVYEFEVQLNLQFEIITKRIHGEEYGVDFDFDSKTGVSSVEIKNAVTNPEGGKKKAEVIAFDFAYIKAVSVSGIKRPRFVFHDSIEDIDHKLIEEIFLLARTLPGQQILSMLSDKLDDVIYGEYEKDVVLFLDEDDRFFKV